MKRRVAAIVLLVLLAAVISAWVISSYRLDNVSYKYGRLLPPNATEKQWTFRARSLSFAQLKGNVSIGLENYRSYAASAGDLDDWNDWQGWSHLSVPAENIRIRERPLYYWRGASDFSLLGFGTYPEGRQGTEVRVVVVPHWMIVCLFVIALELLISPVVRRRLRLRRNLCPNCAYDRHAIPVSDACPECGSRPGAHASNSA